MARSHSTCSIHRGNGETEHRIVSHDEVPAAPGLPTIAGLVPVRDIMSRGVTCARDDLSLDEVIELIVKGYIGCVPVVDEVGAPIGMITKRDLLEQRHRAGPATAGDVMLPLAFTLDEHATVAQAAALMTSEGIHHVPIVSGAGRLIGVVSTLDVVRWLVRNDGLLAT